MATDLTLTVDDDLLERARRVAAQRRTTVDTLLQNYLVQLAGQGSSEQGDKGAKSRLELEKLFRETDAEVGPITWTRDDLYGR
jgi:Family of unknown function (DUF6364)